jgi:hypothetical protein
VLCVRNICLLNQQMHTFYLLYNKIFYSKISPTCFGSLFWDHHQGTIMRITQNINQQIMVHIKSQKVKCRLCQLFLWVHCVLEDVSNYGRLAQTVGRRDTSHIIPLLVNLTVQRDRPSSGMQHVKGCKPSR